MNFIKAETKNDANFIQKIFSKSNTRYLPTKKVSIKEIEKELNNKNKLYFIIKIGNKKIGFIDLNKNISNPKSAKIGIVIDSSFQDRGYGSKAISNIERVAKKEGIEELTLEVSSKNKKAISVYQKNGYKSFNTLIYMNKKI